MMLDKRALEKAMKSLGMKQQTIDAEEVVIKTKDKDIVIENPGVALIDMAGQKIFQISGEIIERQRFPFSEDDIRLVMEKSKSSYENAKSALEETGDIAEAILKLKG